MTLPPQDAAPTLGNWDLTPWLERHRPFSAAAKVDLQRVLQKHDASARASVAPAVVFLKHPQHMKALIQAGFSFTTLIVPNHVQGPCPTKEPEDVRRWALYSNATKQTHALLDAQGVPKLPEAEVRRSLADYLRDGWHNSLRYLLYTHPDQSRPWAQESVTLSMLDVNQWLQLPAPRHNAMMVDLLVCGMSIDELRASVQDRAPQNSAHFERLFAMARARILTAADAGDVQRPTIKAPRF